MMPIVLAGDFRSESERRAWADLWQRTPGAQPFLHPTWHPDHSNLMIVSSWKGSRLTGVLPLSRRLGGFQSNGSARSDILDPLAECGETRRTLLEFALSQPRGLISLSGLLEPHPEFGTQDASGQRIPLPRGWDEFERRLGSSLRQDLRRRKGVTVRTARRSEALPAFEVLVGLHRDRWRRRNLPGAFGFGRARFHRRWLAEGGPARIISLELGGEILAAIYILEGKGIWSYYQSGLRPTPGLSCGSILIAEAIRQAIDEGVSTFDMLRGDEPYKRRWKTESYGIFGVRQYRGPLRKVRSDLGDWMRSAEAVARYQLESRWSRKLG